MEGRDLGAGPPGIVLAIVADDLVGEAILRRLAAAYFLITGRRYAPKGQGTCSSGPLSSALRALFRQAQQCAAQAAGLARTVSDDPCLSRLLEDIQDEAQSHAAQIRVLLEGLL